MPRSQGFTLIELIMVIILLGIVATISVQFVTLSTRGAIDVSERQKRALKGVVISERLSRELRGAVPGSVRVDDSDGNCIRFLPAADGGLYKRNNDETGYEPVNPSGGTPVVASPSGGINVLGEVSESSQTSPESRLYYVDTPVLFYLSESTLYRKSLDELEDDCGGNRTGGVILATRIKPGSGDPFFKTDTPTIRSNSLVTFSFQVDPDSDEPLAFTQTLQVRNVP